MKLEEYLTEHEYDTFRVAYETSGYYFISGGKLLHKLIQGESIREITKNDLTSDIVIDRENSGEIYILEGIHIVSTRIVQYDGDI